MWFNANINVYLSNNVPKSSCHICRQSRKLLDEPYYCLTNECTEDSISILMRLGKEYTFIKIGF